MAAFVYISCRGCMPPPLVPRRRDMPSCRSCGDSSHRPDLRLFAAPLVRAPASVKSRQPVAAFVHIVNNYRGGNYGFPSCHAANSFCLAVYLSLCFRGKRAAVLLFTWAALVSYSRVYLGVHYPGDVIGGMFVGSVYAVVFFYIYVVAVSESKPAVQAARLMFYNVSRRFGHLQVFAEVLICYVRKSFRVKRLR